MKTEYRILTGTIETLAQKVNELDGWDIWGTPFPTGHRIWIGEGIGYSAEIAQAMVRSITKEDFKQ